jgi:Domain of unknown function (DUF4232)
MNGWTGRNRVGRSAMWTWRAVILAAASAGALAGCGVSGATGASPGPGGRASAETSSAGGTTTASPGKLAASRSAAAGPSASPTALYLATGEQVPFAGDAVTVTAQASAGPGTTRWLRLADVTVSFGDGTSGSASQACAGNPVSPAKGLSVRHRYLRAGTFTAQVRSARICGRAGPPDLSGVSAAMRVLPAAPAASVSWPICAGAGAQVAARGVGAGLGHVGVLFTVRNATASGCRLTGYAGLRLLGPGGGPLPTSVHHATSGTYLFPPVAPHLVALRPGGYAAFLLEYEDNPWGALASEPYAKACPAATDARVSLPGVSAARVISVVGAAMAPCGGEVWISPVIPGRAWINFP